MEKPKSSASQQASLGSLVAIIVFSGVVVSAFLAQLAPPLTPVPEIAASLSASTMLLGLLFFPLLWGRSKAGYIGAILVGIYVLIQSTFPLSMQIVAPTPFLAVLITVVAISVVLIATSAAASRAKT